MRPVCRTALSCNFSRVLSATHNTLLVVVPSLTVVDQSIHSLISIILRTILDSFRNAAGLQDRFVLQFFTRFKRNTQYRSPNLFLTPVLIPRTHKILQDA
jgi:hypothetical protein